MAQETTVARPYAEAAFDLARGADALAGWADGLANAAAVVADERVDALLRNPRVEAEQKAGFILEVCGESLDLQQRNFIRLLVERDRIGVLPEIRRQYDELRARHERTLDAELVTAQPVDDAVRDRVAAALSKRLDRTVSLDARVDETLIGGAIVRAGDMVIDGSVRGRLASLTGAISR
ncbi:F0F1 ATP synthase subunit delta [Spiribacter pallidus]|jgi:F-type H+-transporting ATPase subunit delta|uniref:ATP synthase subunit delta n=1 Tax=Spiribacter pallidus TaxID=1987936 RepID=A0ABV3TED6_9GAMM